ncbi:hypothetical protein [Sphingomonas trueperi]|uniref:hypothetical protein n=1 Tax=Sphingomonas trueperi TaxID=53317 RepID=UPI001603F42A
MCAAGAASRGRTCIGRCHVFQVRDEHQRIASYARKLVQAPPADKELNGSCWTAAYAAMRRAGAITREQEQKMVEASSGGSLAVLGSNQLRIASRADFLAISAGKIIAFVRPRAPGTLPKLSHVAISMGAGTIAGTNNAIVGGPYNWGITDLNAILFEDGQAQIADIGGRREAYTVYLITFEPIKHPQCVIM